MIPNIMIQWDTRENKKMAFGYAMFFVDRKTGVVPAWKTGTAWTVGVSGGFRSWNGLRMAFRWSLPE